MVKVGMISVSYIDVRIDATVWDHWHRKVHLHAQFRVGKAGVRTSCVQVRTAYFWSPESHVSE